MEDPMPSRLVKAVRKTKDADILVTIPCYNSAHTITYVMHQVSKGLTQHFPKKKSMILVVDGHSKDGSVDVARNIKLPVEAVVTRYSVATKPGGKGAALIPAFKAAEKLGAEAFVMVDSDLRSITPEWVKLLAGPCLKKHADHVTPFYSRFKFDATITNFVCYPLIRSLFGKQVRQPIGGDFGVSKKGIRAFLDSPFLESKLTRQFGIDIFMTATIMGEGLKSAEAVLGSKIHDARDPGADLGPMFKQVVGNLFALSDHYLQGCEHIKHSRHVPKYHGNIRIAEPEPFSVDTRSMINRFIKGRKKHRALMEDALSKKVYRQIYSIPDSYEDFLYEPELWAKTAYELMAAYVGSPAAGKRKVVDALQSLWLGKVASFTLEARDLSNREAEHLIEEQALVFEENKPLLYGCLKKTT